MVVTCRLGGVEETLRLIARGKDIDMKVLSEKFGVRPVDPMLLGT
jgi:hypothetical protein